MKTLFAVHNTFDCPDYNEHFYFESFAEAEERFKEIKNYMEKSERIVEVYSDVPTHFYVQLKYGMHAIYIEEINL